MPDATNITKPFSDQISTADYNAQRSIQQAIEEREEELWNINQKIHQNPELAFEEVQAHDNICALLEKLDSEFRVTRHAHGISTAFTAEFGSGEQVVGINAEYDALPGIGHACGHNLIAEAGIASFLGLVAILRKSSIPGRVRLIGTPAEEGGGGKLKLINAGAYRDVDICMMVHPYSFERCPGFTGDAYTPTLANNKFTIKYTGKEAHGAMAPWQGVNALDAVVLAYNAISALRQQIKPYERIHGVIVNGGTRPNVISAHTETCYYIRSRTLQEADDLKARAMKCFEGAAMATGCTMTHEVLNTYADLRPNPTLCSTYASAMAAYGSVVKFDTNVTATGGSTDMGNVSYECPGFQAGFGIPTDVGIYNHTLGFAEAAGTRRAHSLALETAKGMALTGWRYLTDRKITIAVNCDFQRDIKH